MYKLTQASLQEREEQVRQKEEKQLSGFYTALVEFYTVEVLWGFPPCGFPEENLCVLLCCCTCISFNNHLLMVVML